MARNLYGCTSADFTLTESGRVVAGATATVWTARTGGTQVTDLTDLDGDAITLVTSDADGGIRFYGVDGDKDTYWLDTGTGARIAVRPADLTGETGPTPDLSIGTVNTGTAAATITGTAEDPVLNLTLPTAGANGVDTAAIQDGAVTSAKIADGTITGTDVAADTFAAFGTVGNLLTANQASGTDATGTTDGFTPGSQCNLTSGGTAGSRYLLVTATGSGCRVHMYGGITSGTMPVTPGDTYTFRALAKSDMVTKRFRLSIYWWTSAGNVAASTARFDGPDTAMSTSYKDIGFTAVAPANAAYCSLVLTRSDGDVIAGDTFHLRAFSFHRGAAGTWQLPGVPIPGQSHIAVNNAVHLSGTGTPEGVVTAAPGSTWLQTDSTTDVKGWLRWIKASGTGNTGWVAGPEADTGWRDVTSLLANGWAGGYVYLRRIGRNVEFDMSALSAASATSGVPFTLPAGFRIGAPNASWRGLVYKTDLTLRRTATDAVSGQFTITGYAAGDSLYGTGLGLTADSWPTSLPGSAA